VKLLISTLIAGMLLTVAGVQAIAQDPHRTAPKVTLTHVPGGDDRPDGQIDEDESGFDCGYDGNRVCGGTFRRWTTSCADYYKRADRYTRCVEIGVLNLEHHNFSGWGDSP
jgi:hypothetical protein